MSPFVLRETFTTQGFEGAEAPSSSGRLIDPPMGGSRGLLEEDLFQRQGCRRPGLVLIWLGQYASSSLLSNTLGFSAEFFPQTV